MMINVNPFSIAKSPKYIKSHAAHNVNISDLSNVNMKNNNNESNVPKRCSVNEYTYININALYNTCGRLA